jgi:hypothetical protein
MSPRKRTARTSSKSNIPPPRDPPRGWPGGRRAGFEPETNPMGRPDQFVSSRGRMQVIGTTECHLGSCRSKDARPRGNVRGFRRVLFGAMENPPQVRGTTSRPTGAGMSRRGSSRTTRATSRRTPTWDTMRSSRAGTSSRSAAGRTHGGSSAWRGRPICNARTGRWRTSQGSTPWRPKPKRRSGTKPRMVRSVRSTRRRSVGSEKYSPRLRPHASRPARPGGLATAKGSARPQCETTRRRARIWRTCWRWRWPPNVWTKCSVG